MKANTSISQKIGSAIFVIDAIYMFGLGWLYSWRIVPADGWPLLVTEFESGDDPVNPFPI